MSEQRSGWPGGVGDETLACLNGWPEGTMGHGQEQQLIHDLNGLCQVHGYGRMEQLMSAIEEIWRDPVEGTRKWQALRDERMELLKATASHYDKKRKNAPTKRVGRADD